MPRYSKHAQDRMSQRGIRKKRIEQCLKCPDIVIEPGKGLRQVVKTFEDGRRLKVVVDVEKDVVVSAMWL